MGKTKHHLHRSALWRHGRPALHAQCQCHAPAAARGEHTGSAKDGGMTNFMCVRLVQSSAFGPFGKSRMRCRACAHAVGSRCVLRHGLSWALIHEPILTMCQHLRYSSGCSGPVEHWLARYTCRAGQQTLKRMRRRFGQLHAQALV